MDCCVASAEWRSDVIALSRRKLDESQSAHTSQLRLMQRAGMLRERTVLLLQTLGGAVIQSSRGDGASSRGDEASSRCICLLTESLWYPGVGVPSQ